MKKFNDTKIQRNPTFKTLKKVRALLQQHKGVFSINYLSKSLNIHYYSLCPIIDELLLNGEISEIESTSKGRLFQKNGTNV